jgi:hypothetical protein
LPDTRCGVDSILRWREEVWRVPVQVFTLVLDRQPSDEELERFLVSWDDAVFGVESHHPVVHFDRDSPVLADAIASAVKDVESIGLKALRVVDGDLLTLADIADRVGQSRESIRRYATGERGKGNFPPPVNPHREGTVFYRWSEVAPWLQEAGLSVPDVDAALVVANLVLQARQHRDRVQHMSALSDLLAA